jgi:hypothetical protein
MVPEIDPIERQNQAALKGMRHLRHDPAKTCRHRADHAAKFELR